MIIENSLYVLMRKINATEVLKSWFEHIVCDNHKADESGANKPYLYIQPDEYTFTKRLTDSFMHYSLNEAESAYKFMNSVAAMNKCRLGCGVFGMLAYSVREILRTDIRRECLCKRENLLRFRELTHIIDPLIFQCAFLADLDVSECYDRKVFSWPVIVRTDNMRLHKILDRGIAENHFHIGGSASAFMFSWICLMNHYSTERAKEFVDAKLDHRDLISEKPLNYSSNYSMVFKAACIRIFLYARLRGEWVCDGDDPQKSSEQWLIRCLGADNHECDYFIDELDLKLSSWRSICKPDTNDGFVPDYAMFGEPLPPLDDADISSSYDIAVKNYERRLYRPLSGEQRFIYGCLKKIYSNDMEFKLYAELFYAYLLVYCKIRGLLIQSNGKYGLGNFVEYQDRKNVFTRSYPDYANMRIRIAQQGVLSNPQVLSFEGRLCPESTAQENIENIKYYYARAIDPYYSVENFKSFDDYLSYERLLEDQAKKKLHYVLHFPKTTQSVGNDVLDGMITPRNAKRRNIIRQDAEAVLEAKCMDIDTMSLVSGIDACSNEIGCRPEVFACDFRRLRSWKVPGEQYFEQKSVPINCRLTYHVGEDFLCPIDGMRAIDEARRFLQMHDGDRLGHALALGVDCEEWYSLKQFHIILPKQDLLDNLVWLYHKLKEYGIYNAEAIHEIERMFALLYPYIYLTEQNNTSGILSVLASVTLDDYYTSMTLRGNSPWLYAKNPLSDPNGFRADMRQAELEPWLMIDKYSKLSSHKTNLLYHLYHYDYEGKKRSEELQEYTIRRCIITATHDVQKALQHDLSRRNIGVECNPSSNFLIGTFRDYAKHPIFVFNDKGLFNLPENPLLQASINTDDLGIFDTCLENEYALIVAALETANLYSDNLIPTENIYDWMDHIRSIGCNQSFKRMSLEQIDANESHNSS